MTQGPHVYARNFILEYKKTILECCVVAFCTAPAHAGFMLVFFVPFFMFWLLYSLFVIWRRPERRRSQTVRLVLWSILFTSIGCTHWYYASASRKDAEMVAQKLLLYKANHGTFPPSLAEVDLDADGLKRRWMLYYSMSRNEPLLFYASTFTLFETYSYDFKKNEWNYDPD